MRIEQIRQTLRTHGAKTCHEERIMRAWLQAQPLASGPRRRPAEDFHPLELRDRKRTFAARWPVRIDPGRLCRRLRFLHDWPRWLVAPGR